ncbi:MAG: energy-coupling factor transporter ATPase [Firmicutes bacterium]|nr:energy-coupling factor transporter ATPase [Bacillota bacterium]
MGIKTEGLTHVYDGGGPFPVTAIEDINLEIAEGEFWGIIGPTGSGKSTLIQHFNGLLKPTRGRLLVDGEDLWARKGYSRDVRKKVGLVFQYPEHQLFEETVEADVGFGPSNQKLPREEIRARVRRAIDLVGLPESILPRSPFELSGGQMRRVAIAGVLAMEPRILILDEPTAGLDPGGREEILGQIRRLHQEEGLTVVLVSHRMEDIARLANKVAVMHRGRLVFAGTTREAFRQVDLLQSIGLGVPHVTRLMHLLKERGRRVRTDVLTVTEAAEEILGQYSQRDVGNQETAGVLLGSADELRSE